MRYRSVPISMRWLLPAIALGIPSGTRAAADTDVRVSAAATSTPSANRIVHRFDFDERAQGNLEDVPKYWDKLRPAGFPHFVFGAFDFDVGHAAPPSFHLASDGRNVAYQYSGPETKIRANTDYRIEGYVRADHLRHARACLSAHFLNRRGEPLAATLVRSPWIGGSDATDAWVRVELHLAAAPHEAQTIGLLAWVLQEPQWNTAPRPAWHIPRDDLHGGAWFDDITIFALPRVRLETGSLGNVMTSSDPMELRVLVSDDKLPAPRGQLTILAADGDEVETHDIQAVIGKTAQPTRVSVEQLAPGLYTARLDVLSDGIVIVSRALTFARLADRVRPDDARSRRFGIAVDPRRRSDLATELALFDHLTVRAAKLPIWTGLADEDESPAKRRAAARMLRELVKRGFALSGVFFASPSAIAKTDGVHVRPLLNLLADDPDAWKDHLAAVVAPSAGLFRWWQIGPDGDPPTADRQSTERAVTQLRAAMRPFITMPRLAMPVSPFDEATPTKALVEQAALDLAPEVPWTDISDRMKRLRAGGYEQVSAYVEPLPAVGYDRIERIADWARRVVAARHAGAAPVVAPQLWRPRESVQGIITEPTESFIVFRTMADILGESEPGPQLRLGQGVTAMAFFDGPTATLAMWDSAAPSGGRLHAVQLGRADRQIDVWGVATPLARDERGRQLVRLSSMPTFVLGVQRWLIDFRSSITIEPARVEAGNELVTHTLRIAYQGNRAVSGRVVLDVPKTWEVSPPQFAFSVLPQRVRSHAVHMRYPYNEPAGIKTVIARIDLPSDGYYLEVPLSIEIGVADIAVWGSAVVDHGVLVLRHFITNRSNVSLSFRASATVPGRERQNRPIADLRPGDTQTVEYRIPGGEAMIGRTVRLMLREVNDGPRVYNLDVRVP